jgi:tetratricopeptide (TPR) repeat protein
MTETSRLETLKQMVAQEPDDEFSRYALALEFKKLAEIEESIKHFDVLNQNSPDYVPAYFMAGQMLADEGRIEDAQQRLKEGIAAAQRVNDKHAEMEMTEFLESL